MELLVWIIFFVIFFAIIATYALGGWLAAPWVPLWKNDIYRMLKVAQVKPDEKVFDLGAGDGRFLIMAAQEFKAQGVGFEIAVLPYLIGCFKIYIKGLSGRIKFKYRNFFTENIDQADVICLFLTPTGLVKLKTKLEKETKKGVRIVSYAFPIAGWTPVLVDKPSEKMGKIYLYQR